MSLFGPRYPMLRQVIVNMNTRGDEAFKGLLWQRRGEYLVLRQAVMLRGRGEGTALDGEVAIPASNVAFIQVVS